MAKLPSLKRTYSKVVDTIKSCKTKDQLKSASRMVDNFKSMYKEVDYPKALSYNLNNYIEQKYMLLESSNKAYGK
jgi:predicted S18 family serine protease